MSPGGDCRFGYHWCACLQVGTATLIMVFWGLCVHVSRWGLSLLLSSVCMSPGGDCRLRHRILGALCTCLQVGTVAFVIVGLHVSRWGLLPSLSYSGGLFVHVSRWRLSLSLSLARMSPGGECCLCYRILPLNAQRFLMLSITAFIFHSLSNVFVQDCGGDCG
jgi:hypothetical protein